nr:hypothetical protein [Desulfuromusa sp.]
QLAEVDDLLTAAERRVTDAEEELGEVKVVFEQNLKKLLEARHESHSEEELKILHKELEVAKTELDKATRRSAKAEAKLEDAQKQLEQFREQHHLPEDEK